MNFLDRMILDNTVRNYLFVFSVIAVVFVFKRLLSHSIASLLYLLIKKKWKSIGKEQFISLTLKPLSWFVVITVFVFALDKLVFPSAWSFNIRKVGTKEIFEKAGITAVIISFFYFAVSFIDFIALLLEENANTAKDKSHGQVVLFFRDLLKVLVAIIGVLFVIKAAFDQNIGSLLTGLSIVGAALALAAKESIENLIASFIIFFDKPFFTGDTLKVNNVSGTVEHIGLRSTRIRTLEKTLVTVPNKQMVDSIVDNLSMRIKWRAEIKLMLSEKSKPAAIQELIDAVKILLDAKQEEIIKSSVFLTNYSKDGIEITIEYFTPPFSRGEFDKEKQKINFLLMQLMSDHELEMSSSAGSINIINDGVITPKQNSII
ncbi:MAG: mechanosensitive ion channel domain-containing protein [Ferruginibacter sp.]